MPRPCKRRRICAMPDCRRFGPSEMSEARQSIVMTLDEYETIRLIDHEGLTQEQCAESMSVARSTVQAIYDSARFKLSECIVDSKELIISGGEYILCTDGDRCVCPRCKGHCHGHKNND